jgi:thiamine biosynthesis protein ThiI
MMMRAGSAITERLGAGAMVTGESVAQVSSQTLQNLSLIDQVADSLVLRPLVTTDKDEIIRLSKQIGTEEFAAAMPEYCGVISVKPTTRARKERIEAEEAKFDFAVLEKAIADAVSTNIEDVAHHKQTGQEVEELSVPVQNGVIIDVRHPTEEERKPLSVPNAQVEKIPFYELHKRFSELDRSKVYLLYCEKGVMSKLHAAHLMDQGYSNVKVYRP